jgi:hypothetical protein
MRILVCLPTDCELIDEIMWYCWHHEQHGINFCSGHNIVYDNKYVTWRIYCEPSKYVDLLLLKYGENLAVY